MFSYLRMLIRPTEHGFSKCAAVAVERDFWGNRAGCVYIYFCTHILAYPVAVFKYVAWVLLRPRIMAEFRRRCAAQRGWGRSLSAGLRPPLHSLATSWPFHSTNLECVSPALSDSGRSQWHPTSFPLFCPQMTQMDWLIGSGFKFLIAFHGIAKSAIIRAICGLFELKKG